MCLFFCMQIHVFVRWGKVFYRSGRQGQCVEHIQVGVTPVRLLSRSVSRTSV